MVKHPETGQVSRAPWQARIDPLELDQDKQVVPRQYPQSGRLGTVVVDSSHTATLSPADSVARESAPSAPAAPETQVFRVQLFTTSLYGEAQRARRVAEEIFEQPVYVDYDVPYFKVRVGSFATRGDAESYRQRATAAGYENTWVVAVNVQLREPTPLYDTLLQAPPPEDSTDARKDRE